MSSTTAVTRVKSLSEERQLASLVQRRCALAESALNRHKQILLQVDFKFSLFFDSCVQVKKRYYYRKKLYYRACMTCEASETHLLVSLGTLSCTYPEDILKIFPTKPIMLLLLFIIMLYLYLLYYAPHQSFFSPFLPVSQSSSRVFEEYTSRATIINIYYICLCTILHYYYCCKIAYYLYLIYHSIIL